MDNETNELLELVEAHLNDERLDEAILLLWKGVGRFPDNLVLKVRLADCLRRASRKDEAIRLYRECALAYADRGRLPFAVALYKVLVPLLGGREGDESHRTLLKELVQRYQKAQLPSAPPKESVAAPEIPLFSDMSREELEAVAQQLVPLRFRAGEVLFKEGDEGASMYIVTRGYVKVSSGGFDGQRIRLAKLGPGDFFGEWSLITGDYRRHAWVESETDVELLELTETTLEAVTERHPRIKDIIHAYYRRRKIDTLLAKVFPTLSAGERRKFSEKLRKEERYPRGTVLYREGDQSEYMSIVQSGTVEVFTYNLDGVRIPLALLGPGQYFGEGGALSGKPRLASVRARTDVVLHHISGADLSQFLENHPDLRKSLQGVRIERIGATLERLEFSDSSEQDGGGFPSDTAGGDAK